MKQTSIKKKNGVAELLVTNAKTGTQMVTKPVNKFLLFLENKAVLSLAIGVIIADTVKQIVNVVVDGIIRPFLGLFLPTSNDFAPLNIKIANVVFKFGDLLSTVLQTFIIFVILYIFLAWLLKKEDLLGTDAEKDKKVKKEK